MNGLDVVWMLVPPHPSHSFRIPVVSHDIAVIRELVVANRAFPALHHDFPVQEFPLLCG